MTSLVWIRKDFRMHDHPALFHGAENGEILPVFILDDREEIGEAQKWFYHHALDSFTKRLENAGGKLLIQKGNPEKIIPDLIKKYDIKKIFWNRQYEPDLMNSDRSLGENLHEQGIEVNTYEGRLLLSPWEVRKANDEPYKVFTPFYRAMQKHDIPAPLKSVKNISSPAIKKGTSIELKDLKLLPEINWTDGFEKRWTVSEEAAIRRFKAFVKNNLGNYKDGRDFPADEISSALSPYFALGLLSPRSTWHFIKKKAEAAGEPFLRQLVWRDFAYMLLVHFPETVSEPMNDQFSSFDWLEDQDGLQAWKKGRTGFPIVDAGMRELWETGYMHNRIRMVTASFLTKDLLIHWKEGADWFTYTLLDADLANNTMGWQWVAGSGADASPFFRIFNPITQSKKFDPDADYIRKWVPELAKLPDKYIHEPAAAPEEVLSKAGVKLGDNYPKPIVDHSAARKRALEHYEKIKNR
ncbi:cryptochrome/photolyase family protein [Jeotgalibacillus aurantiacus]|uniref:cryptochrome/photolyase family protein n=1 Tax=Jeotgalibacillus aurantiacus TaxID=2763266 RepID=UPI001D09C694|nr:deoxyribodipyrimidine photo-lyase [Jeotgalibacillus aurantiacus]